MMLRRRRISSISQCALILIIFNLCTNAQNIICSPHDAKCKTINCVENDCRIECFANGSCDDSIINAGNSSLQLLCYGRESCYPTKIIAWGGIVTIECNDNAACHDLDIEKKLTGDLYLKCTSEYDVCGGLNLLCPPNSECSVECDGQQSCYSARIKGNNGTKLSIAAEGDRALWSALIVCPPDYISGKGYSNDASCKIRSSGYKSMDNLKIKSMDSWNSVELECTTSDCISNSLYNPYIFCGHDLEEQCQLEAISNNKWKCIEENHVCDNLSTLFPTAAPSISPTTPPTSAPTDDCRAISVTVYDKFEDFDLYFNGLYERVTKQSETPYWEVPQLRDEMYLKYGGNKTWRLYGQKIDENTTHYLEVYDRLFLQKFDANIQNWMWTYSEDAQKYAVDIKCIGSVSPTAAPSFSPTHSPTTSPTSKPTKDPTIDPTKDPTNDPSMEPTLEPTAQPTVDPTNAPSFSPSNVPSSAPSQSPTRVPTSSSDYDSFIDIKYFIAQMDWKDVQLLANMNGEFKVNETMNVDVTNLIEEAYVNLDWTLHFHEFYVRIDSVKGFKISYLNNRKRPGVPLTDDCWLKGDNACKVTFESKIFCDSTICDYIYDKFPPHKNEFQRLMTVNLFEYIHPYENISESDPKMYFAVGNTQKPLLIDPPIPKWFQVIENWIIIFLGILFIVIIFMVFFFKHRIKKMRIKKQFVVQNPMVLLVSIGKYFENMHRKEINGEMKDLEGIENDIKHMTELFEEKFGYDVFPKVDEVDSIRIEWTEKDFNSFIEERARYLLKNINDGKKYDSLILIISCHGIPDYICTSDYRKYSKLAIQRTFSFWAELREIPRFILFDCCSGFQGREVTMKVKTHINDGDESDTQQKVIEEKHIFDGIENKKMWIDDDQNPDHLLARVNAANAGFTSSLNRETGSYLIHKMYKKYMDALDGRRSPFPFIHEIFDEIQTELQEEGKQLPESVWNDKTRYLVFKKRNVGNNSPLPITKMMFPVLTTEKCEDADAENDNEDLSQCAKADGNKAREGSAELVYANSSDNHKDSVKNTASAQIVYNDDYNFEQIQTAIETEMVRMDPDNAFEE